MEHVWPAESFGRDCQTIKKNPWIMKRVRTRRRFVGPGSLGDCRYAPVKGLPP